MFQNIIQNCPRSNTQKSSDGVPARRKVILFGGNVLYFFHYELKFFPKSLVEDGLF